MIISAIYQSNPLGMSITELHYHSFVKFIKNSLDSEVSNRDYANNSKDKESKYIKYIVTTCMAIFKKNPYLV